MGKKFDLFFIEMTMPEIETLFSLESAKFTWRLFVWLFAIDSIQLRYQNDVQKVN